MTVYVDDMLRPARVGRTHSRWSHMLADTHQELMDMAAEMGGPESMTWHLLALIVLMLAWVRFGTLVRPAMTDIHRPPACHYDRALAQRVTRDHRGDCRSKHGGQCPAAGHGCAPCTAPHCVICGREHTNNDHPHTCPHCIARIREDLTDLQTCYTDLHREALDAGADGRLVAAAPIPGGTAQVLIGPTVRFDAFRTYRGFRKDHRPKDPIPPLAVLAQWEDIYRHWLDHTPARRASVAGSITYLAGQLDYIANHIDHAAPDFLAFTRQIRTLRAALERVLHDEQEPERGVECFECGDRLVRRFRDPKRCRHSTPARDWFRAGLDLVCLGYHELMPNPAEARAARRPCGKCQQGGIDDPTPSRSWECPGCRKEYTPSEYVTAMRRDLLENGGEGAGWCSLPIAAEAARELTGRPITVPVIRTWIDRKDEIAQCSEWRPGLKFGARLVFWPDVALRATEYRAKGRRATPKAS